jgi:glyoxylase-like metal-dependent hydrolase (beta-lactamase superfamily II)
VKRTERIVEGVYRIRLGWVNAFLIARAAPWALVDCGVAGHERLVGEALRELGGDWDALGHILVTHCHPDHAGALAAIQQLAPRAQTYMGHDDAVPVRRGVALPPERPLEPAPGLHNLVLYHTLLRTAPRHIEAARVDTEVFDGQRLEIAGGVTAIHTPGHTRGHVCYLWHGGGGVLFAGDVASSVWGPGFSVAYEDFAVGQQTLTELAAHPFECICFGHGKSILRCGNRRWAEQFAPAEAAPSLAASEPG